MKIENTIPRSALRGASRKSPRGFTLIELLVVIAIISLLVSILLPSLNRAKDLAKRVVCASNLHHIMLAYNCYASEYNGSVPVGYMSGSKAWNYLIYHATEGYVSFGYLRLAGLMDDPMLFYCPVQASIYFDVWWNPWPPEAGSYTRAGYSSRPEVQWSSQFDPPSPFPSINDLGNKAVVADFVTSPSSVDDGHKEGVNVSYGDSSSLWVEADLIQDDLDGLTHGSDLDNVFMDNIWDTFDQER